MTKKQKDMWLFIVCIAVIIINSICVGFYDTIKAAGFDYTALGTILYILPLGGICRHICEGD